MSSQTQPLLHHAEEQGQSREYSIKEAQGIVLAAIFCGAWGALAAVVLTVGYWIYERSGLTTALLWVGAPAAFLAVGGAVLLKGIPKQLDGLTSWREATTYQPVQPQPEPEPAHPPILVRPYGGEPYALIEGAGRPALPSRDEALRITPPVVAEVLRASIEEYGGEWSRRKLMALRIEGQRITRGMYEELTAWLSKAGLLQQTRQGGFVLPPDVQEFDDLETYFPNLANWDGRAGSRAGRERGGDNETQPANRGMNTGERLCQKFIELECNTAAFLEWRQNHGD